MTFLEGITHFPLLSCHLNYIFFTVNAENSAKARVWGFPFVLLPTYHFHHHHCCHSDRHTMTEFYSVLCLEAVTPFKWPSLTIGSRNNVVFCTPVVGCPRRTMATDWAEDYFSCRWRLWYTLNWWHEKLVDDTNIEGKHHEQWHIHQRLPKPSQVSVTIHYHTYIHAEVTHHWLFLSDYLNHHPCSHWLSAVEAAARRVRVPRREMAENAWTQTD